MVKKDLYNFIKEDDINEASIDFFMSTSNSCRTKSQLIGRSFKLLNYFITDMVPNETNIEMLEKIINFIAYICGTSDFNRDQIDTNRIRIKKARENIIILANKYLNDDLLACANKLDEIVLDKNLKVDDIISIIKALIDRTEDINIIKKIININKLSILEDNNTLFEYAFDKAIDAIKDNSNLAYYYISLLKVLYASNIDKAKYLDKLLEIPSDSSYANELYMIVNGIRRGLTRDEVLDKYLIETKLTNQRIILPGSDQQDDIIITIDNNGTYVREDGLSVYKDGNKYIVGIHICDSGKYIVPESIQDKQARQNFKCTFNFGKRVTSLFHNDIEKKLSLTEGHSKPVISLYAVIDSSGELKDYYIIENNVLVGNNLTYSNSNNYIEKGSTELSKKLRYLFDIANTLEHKDSRKKKYWEQKENSTTQPEERDNSKSDIIIREFMVLYNYLIATIANESKIPYVYRGQYKEYISELVDELGIETNEYTDTLIRDIYLDSFYSSRPIKHSGLDKPIYSSSCDPLRKYPDLYNQYLIHKFYFKDIDFEFDPERMEMYIKYFNQRSGDIDLMESEYHRARKK